MQGVSGLKKNFWWRVLINAAALYLIARYAVGGLRFTGPISILVAGFVLGVVNALIRPLFVILALPFSLLTLGLFTFIVNGFMLKITSWLVPGFSIDGFFTAVWASILLSLFSAVVNSLLRDDRRRY